MFKSLKRLQLKRRGLMTEKTRRKQSEREWVELLREIRYSPGAGPQLTAGWIAPSHGSCRKAVTVPRFGEGASSGALSMQNTLMRKLLPTM